MTLQDLTTMRHVYRAAGYLLIPRIALPRRFAGEDECKLHSKTVGGWAPPN